MVNSIRSTKANLARIFVLNSVLMYSPNVDEEKWFQLPNQRSAIDNQTRCIWMYFMFALLSNNTIHNVFLCPMKQAWSSMVKLGGNADVSWLSAVMFRPAWCALTTSSTQAWSCFLSEIASGFLVSSGLRKNGRSVRDTVSLNASARGIDSHIKEIIKFLLSNCLQLMDTFHYLVGHNNRWSPLFSFQGFPNFSNASTKAITFLRKSSLNFVYISWCLSSSEEGNKVFSKSFTICTISGKEAMITLFPGPGSLGKRNDDITKVSTRRWRCQLFSFVMVTTE